MKDQFTKTTQLITPEFRHKGLRIGTLWFSPTQGTGDVSLSPFYFEGLGFDTQMDVISDCEALLSQHVDRMLLDHYQEVEKKRKLHRLTA